MMSSLSYIRAKKFIIVHSHHRGFVHTVQRGSYYIV